MVPNDTVDKSVIRIERVKGPLRRAYLPVDRQPVLLELYVFLDHPMGYAE